MLSRTVTSAVLGLLLAGCSDVTGVRQNGIEVAIDESGLTVHNGRRDSIYIFASEATTAQLILWGPCVEPPKCNGVPPGETVHFDKSKVVGWGQSNEVILWWWHLVPSNQGGLQTDSVRAVVIRGE